MKATLISPTGSVSLDDARELRIDVEEGGERIGPFTIRICGGQLVVGDDENGHAIIVLAQCDADGNPALVLHDNRKGTLETTWEKPLSSGEAEDADDLAAIHEARVADAGKPGLTVAQARVVLEMVDEGKPSGPLAEARARMSEYDLGTEPLPYDPLHFTMTQMLSCADQSFKWVLLRHRTGATFYVVESWRTFPEKAALDTACAASIHEFPLEEAVA